MSPQVGWEALGAVRFFLACVVVGTHLTYFSTAKHWPTAFATVLGGKAAVIGFLLVSGYSIAASLEAAPVGFYRRRFLRIYPLYLASIVLALVVEVATGGHVVTPLRTIDSVGWVANVGNALLLQTFAVKTMAFNGPIWSLSIEVFYYALAPLLLRLPRKTLVTLTLFSLACFMLPTHKDPGMVYFFLTKFNALRYMWCWLLGFLLWHDRGAILAVFAAAIAGLLFFNENTPERLSALTYAVAAGAIIFADRLTLQRVPGQVAEYLGDLSYPLYLFHYPVLILMWHSGVDNSLLMACAVCAVTVAAHHLIDKRLKPRFITPLLFSKTGRSQPQRLQSAIG